MSTPNPKLTEADFNQIDRAFKAPGWKLGNKKFKIVKALLMEEQRRVSALHTDKPTYFSVDAPPSLKPPKHWCDITGLEGIYKSGRHSGLRYHNKEIYEVVRELGPGVDQQYLGLRNANVILR
jgi:INO80 complex subunit C